MTVFVLLHLLHTFRTLLLSLSAVELVFCFPGEKKIFFCLIRRELPQAPTTLSACLLASMTFLHRTMDRLPVFLAKALLLSYSRRRLSQQFSLCIINISLFTGSVSLEKKKSYYFSHLRAVKQTCHSKACWKSSLCVSHFSSSTLESSPSGFHPPKTTLPSQCHK